MATLYVENVPDEVYEALRQRAKENRQSITAEVIALLKENVPTSEELARRRSSWNCALKIRSRKPVAGVRSPVRKKCSGRIVSVDAVRARRQRGGKLVFTICAGVTRGCGGRDVT